MKSVNKRVMTMAFVGLFSAVSGSVFAAGASSAFKSYDANSDGKISMEEYEAQGGTKSSFSTIDADGNKNLSKDEFAQVDSGSGYSGSTGSSGTGDSMSAPAESDPSGGSTTTPAAPATPASPSSGGGM